LSHCLALRFFLTLCGSQDISASTAICRDASAIELVTRPRVKVLGIPLRNAGYWVVSAAARSQHRHGWHHRRLQDLPVQGQSVKIRLALNRWQCRHRRCGRRTFTDRLPEIAAPYVRRTERMAEIVGFVGHRMGGRAGENLMHRLGMPVRQPGRARLKPARWLTAFIWFKI
jgi:transposase